MEGENQYQQNNIEQHTQDILTFLEVYTPQEWQPTSFKKFQFQIIWFPEDVADQSTFFSRSTQIDGYDIYISPNLNAEDRKRQLFHELLEIMLNEDGLPDHDVHELTLGEEQRIFGVRK